MALIDSVPHLNGKKSPVHEVVPLRILSSLFKFQSKQKNPHPKSFIDGAADYFDNRRDAERVPSAILLSAICRLVVNFQYFCPSLYKLF